LARVRRTVAAGDREALLSLLAGARAARRGLPVGADDPADLAELRVPVTDRPGVLAEITTLATELGVNIASLEIVHSGEGEAGIVVLVVRSELVGRLSGALADRGYHPTGRHLA
jgi:prephenate dehydrogenase